MISFSFGLGLAKGIGDGDGDLLTVLFATFMGEGEDFRWERPDQFSSLDGDFDGVFDLAALRGPWLMLLPLCWIGEVLWGEGEGDGLLSLLETSCLRV